MLNTGMKSITGEHLQLAPQHVILGGQGEVHPLWGEKEKPSFPKIGRKQEKKLLVKHLSHTPLNESHTCKRHFIATH